MEAITQVMDADQLSSIFDIPDEMRYSRLEVTIRPISKESASLKTKYELLEKFKHGFGEIQEQIRKKVSEGQEFDFNVESYLNGTMTEDDWQNFYKMEKQSWGKHIADMAKEGKYD
jgi:hypothetical protein